MSRFHTKFIILFLCRLLLYCSVYYYSFGLLWIIPLLAASQVKIKENAYAIFLTLQDHFFKTNENSPDRMKFCYWITFSGVNWPCVLRNICQYLTNFFLHFSNQKRWFQMFVCFWAFPILHNSNQSLVKSFWINCYIFAIPRGLPMIRCRTNQFIVIPTVGWVEIKIRVKKESTQSIR